MKKFNVMIPFGSCLLLCACTTVPELPPLPQPEVPKQFVATPPGTRQGVMNAAWWRDFADKELDALVDEALDRNFDLAEARNRIEAARAQISVTHSARAFQLSVDPQASRSKSSSRQSNPYSIAVPAGTALSDVSVQRNPYATNFLLPLDASYEVDLWGRLEAGDQVAVQQGQVSVEDYRVARLALVSNLVSTYLQLRLQQGQVKLLQEEAVLHADLQRNAQARVSAGLADVSTLAQVVVDAEATRRQLADMKKSVQLDVHALEVLCGLQPGALGRFQKQDGVALPALPATPTDLPVAVLQRRPDVRREEASLKAAWQQTAMARADFLPQIRLTSSVGRASDELSALLQPGSMLWSLAAQLSYPLLDGGRVRAAYAQAGAQFEAAAQHYQGTVIQALREVEDALVTLDSLRDQAQAVGLARGAAAAAAWRQQQRHAVGLATRSEYATARLGELQKQGTELDIQAQALIAYVSLRKALGE